MSADAISAHEAAADVARRRGDRAVELDHWQKVIELNPDHSVALNVVGNWALSQSDFGLAFDLLERALANDPGQPALLFNFAMAARAIRQMPKAFEALDAALAIEPYFVQAIFQKAVLLEEVGQNAKAALLFRDVIRCAPLEILTSDQFKPALDHARGRISADGNALTSAALAALNSPPSSSRIGEAINILAGTAKAYVHEPTFLNVPQLPAVCFFERTLSRWLPKLEEASPVILAELNAVIAQDATEKNFPPYVSNPPGTPLNQWAELDHSPAWGALHLWKHGEEIRENTRRFPETERILAEIPRLFLAKRAPNVFFSVLRAGAHIPPHTGVTNARSTVHLGLIIPERCRFRVGNETRNWRSGLAWMFDDSIEHEAWNDSEHDRVILIFDTWNPNLNMREQQDLATVLEATDEHYGSSPSWNNG